MNRRLNQKGGNDSINVQNCDNVNIGLSYAETKDLFIDLFELNFPKFRAIAKDEAERNIEKLSEKFFRRLTQSQIINTVVLESPDFHYILYKAIEIGARNKSDYLQNILADLIVKRIAYDKDDTNKTILNESIATLEKVSNNQMKMLTFSFLAFDYWRRLELNNWEEFNEYIEEYVLPFMDYNYRDIDIQHLDYSGCVNYNYGFGSPSLSQTLKGKIPGLYPELTQHKDEQQYIDSVTHDKLLKSADFFAMMNETKLWAIDPTSVGLMLVSVNFEIEKGYKLDRISEYFE